MFLRRISSLLLVVVLVLGSALPVLAEDTDFDLVDNEEIETEIQDEISIENSSDEDESTLEEIVLEESFENDEDEFNPNVQIEISDEDSETSPEDGKLDDFSVEESIEITEEEPLEAEALKTTYAGLSNPRIVKIGEETEKSSGQRVTWDCIYFGRYPQAEVVPSSNYGMVTNRYLQKGDIIVDSSLYSKLQNATWYSDTTEIGGNKYRRMKESDATYANTSKNYSPYAINNYYRWSTNTATYRYFKYEPIKWRILAIDGSTALILADKALDDQRYNTGDTSVTWETSTIRTWLNGTFKSRAFSSAEQGAIVSTTVVNNDNKYFSGNNTTDKVFLLATSDLFTKDGPNTYMYFRGNAKQYGFASIRYTADEARKCKSSTYAKAMGTKWYTWDNICAGNCDWWLRSPGDRSTRAANGGSSGAVDRHGTDVGYYFLGIRPALRIDLSSSDLWSYAGAECSVHNYVRKKTAATTTKNGKITKTCQACGKIVSTTIKYAKTVKLKATTRAYTGNAIKPAVIIKDSAGNRISSKYYTVTYPTKCTNPGTYKVTVKFKGNYTGTKNLVYKINPKRTGIASLTVFTKGFVVKWKKQATQTSGYQIQYSTSSKMTRAKIVTVPKNTRVSKRITNLLPRKRYYVQVRTYKKVGTKKYYSAWSAKKYVTTKS